MSHATSEVETTENGIEDGSTSKRRESSRNTSRRSRSESTGSPHVTDSSISLYKTEPCQSFTETGYCRYGLKCRFAHGQADIRPLARHKKYKTELCKTYAKSGFCPYGARCRFVHEESERETSRTASPATHGVESSPFGATVGDPSPAMSPFVAPSPSPSLSSTTPSREPENTPVLPPPQVATHHVPVRRPASPALTPIGTPVNKPAVADMKPFDAFQSLSLSAQDDSRFAHPFTLRDAPDTSASLFSESAVSLFGGMVPLGSRSMSVPADHRTSSNSSHVGGLRASPPLRPPELTRNHSLSVGHHPLEQPREDPPSLAIPSSILDSLTTNTKPAPINTTLEDARPRTAANRSRSFDTSEYRYWSHSQEEELATCSSILSHLELHNDSQPLSPSTVEHPELFKQRPPLYPKRASFGYDDIAILPAKEERAFFDNRPKTPDLKPPTVNTIISTPPKAPLSYKPHSSPNKVISSPIKLAQTPPPHSRAKTARATSPQQSPLVLHPMEPVGQFESLGHSRTPAPKKDIRLSAFAVPFSSSPSSPALSVPSRSPARLTPSPSTSRPPAHSPIVMHLPDPALNAEAESPVLSLLSSATTNATTTTATSPTSTTSRASPALSPFPPPFFPKSQKYPTQQKKGNLRKLE